jgi:hypothetical protein
VEERWVESQFRAEAFFGSLYAKERSIRFRRPPGLCFGGPENQQGRSSRMRSAKTSLNSDSTQA